jgi:hypothetical protein
VIPLGKEAVFCGARVRVRVRVRGERAGLPQVSCVVCTFNGRAAHRTNEGFRRGLKLCWSVISLEVMVLGSKKQSPGSSTMSPAVAASTGSKQPCTTAYRSATDTSLFSGLGERQLLPPKQLVPQEPK